MNLKIVFSSIQTVNFKIRAYVMNSLPRYIILGLNFSVKNENIIYFENRNVKIDGNKVKMVDKNKDNTPNKHEFNYMFLTILKIFKLKTDQSREQKSNFRI